MPREKLYTPTQKTVSVDGDFTFVERTLNLPGEVDIYSVAGEMLAVACPAGVDDEKLRARAVGAFATGAKNAMEIDVPYNLPNWEFAQGSGFDGVQEAVYAGAMWADLWSGNGVRVARMMGIMANNLGSSVDEVVGKYVGIISQLKKDHDEIVNPYDQGASAMGIGYRLDRGMSLLGYGWKDERYFKKK